MKRLLLILLALSLFACGDDDYRRYRSSSYYSSTYGSSGYYGYEPFLERVDVYPQTLYYYDSYFTANFYYDDPDGDIVAVCADISACGGYYGWDCFNTPYYLERYGVFSMTFYPPMYCPGLDKQIIYWFLVDSQGNESDYRTTKIYVY